MQIDQPAGAEGPWVCELTEPIEAVDAFRVLVELPHCLFLDSAARDPQLGRYSYVAAEPFHWLALASDCADPLKELREALAGLESRQVDALPRFQGGAAGLLSYDLGQTLERLTAPRFDEFRLPRLAVGLYDTVAAFDHRMGRAWIVSQGWPETDASRREARARSRIASWLELLRWGPSERRRRDGGGVQRRDLAGPQYASPRYPGLFSNFDAAGYQQVVAAGIEAIRAGDVFQVNLSQRLAYPATSDAVSLYGRLRERNPAPFAGYFDLGEHQLVSASPERFLQVANGQVETRPIKGTRLRAGVGEADLFVGDDLRSSEKDRAENVMIVDLMRNDLSRVCRPNSVKVTQLCQVERYQYVQHLVSAVVGELDESSDSLDLLRAAFPGGSITGAPKIRAMELISQLEPHARGAYCGSLGYLNWDGAIDFSILIRTITVSGGWWLIPVGGGVVSQSDPRAEYEETWHKAEGMLRGLAEE